MKEHEDRREKNVFIFNCRRLYISIKYYFINLSHVIPLRSINILTRLIIFFVLLSFLPLAISSLISYRKSSEDIQNKTVTYSVQMMTLVSRNMNTVVTHFESLCEELAMTSEIQTGLMQYAGSDRYMKYQLEDEITLKFIEKIRLSSFNSSSSITSINIILDENTIIGTGQNYYSEEQFREIFRTFTDDQVEYKYDLIRDMNGDFQITVKKTIRNHSDGRKIGLLVLTFRETILSDIFRELDIGKDTKVFITDMSGLVLSSNDVSKVPVNTEYGDGNLIENIHKNSKAGKLNFTMELNGEKSLVGFSKIENCDWVAIITIPYEYIQKESKKLMWEIILIGILCMAIAVPVSLVISYSIADPLRNLSNLMNIVRNGKLDIEMVDHNRDETAEIAMSFNEMVKSIRQAKNELSKLNSELELRVKDRTMEIEQALRQLMETEKMAALGELVAGIAHEINTPIGIGVTAASHLEYRTRHFVESLKNSVNEKSEFLKYMEIAAESSKLIGANLNRAAELIKSFKQIAVDQTSEEKREFKLREYVEQVLLSLHPHLKKRNLSININCQADISINSYPGIIAQIITNLVMNSILHGLENEKKGEIMFDAEIRENHLIFVYRDNGKGMDKKIRNRIFEPFFTTKRGQGGSGLGMYVVYNLVNQKLHGEIQCKSSPGHGVLFRIKVPL